MPSAYLSRAITYQMAGRRIIWQKNFFKYAAEVNLINKNVGMVPEYANSMKQVISIVIDMLLEIMILLTRDFPRLLIFIFAIK